LPDDEAIRIETMNAWHSLLANLAIVAIFVSVWTQLGDAGPAQRLWRTPLLAALLSAGTIAVSATQIEIRPGVFTDFRTTIVVLSAFYGGPVVGIIVFISAVVYRLWVDGVGAPTALISIAIAIAIGTIGRLALKGRAPNRKDALIVAAVAAGGSLAEYLLLQPAMRATLHPDVAVAVATMTFVVMAVAGLAIVGDIRRRETARENRLYAAIINALPEPLHAKDLTHRFLAANPASAALMQVKDAAQLIGHTDFDFYPPETAAQFERDEDMLIEEGKPATLRQPVTFKDGTTGWLATLKAPIRDASGTLIGFITHNRDITERVRLEEGYAESQRRLQEANAQLEALAKTDALTGLPNRRAFDEALEIEFARNARVGRPMSFFVADVDRFKTYNDTYGHPQGDECLKAVGDTLRHVLKRTTDFAGRYGGEEFVALLPDTDAAGALALADAFRQAVRELKIPHSLSEKGYVTVTVGVATSASSTSGSPALLVRRADAALYSGKAAGRDCTRQAPPETDDDDHLRLAG
jgi:diguanylate cyclase (GGDEF)-like protein/PAS domain S-box-containing protein